MLNAEAKIGIVTIYTIFLVLSLLPSIPSLSPSQHHSLAILNEYCKIGVYKTVFYINTSGRFCVYASNHSGHTQIYLATITIHNTNTSKIIGNYTFVMLPEDNITIPFEVTFHEIGNNTISVQLYVYENGGWHFTGLQVNITVSVFGGPGEEIK